MDQITFLLIMLGIFFCMGLGIIGFGTYGLLHGLTTSAAQWQKELMSWQIIGPNTSSQTLTDVRRSWNYLMSMSILAGGIGLVLMAIFWVSIALLAGGTASINSDNSAFVLASFFLSLGSGAGIGAVFAAWRLRKTATRSGTTYADLRRRRLSDYRSNVFRWLVVVMIVWTFGVLLLLAPHAGSTLPIDLFYKVVSVPTTVWGLSIVPAIMLLVVILIEIILLRIVRFSRLLVTSDSTVSQHADDMLRALVIGLVQYYELFAIGQLASLPFSLLSQQLWASHYWQDGHHPYLGLLSVCVYLPTAMQILGLGIIVMRGHLGGKISRWPWQTHPAIQAESSY
jgi:hypothetical protein